mmetsp:Transcript_142916/g.398202  ORF Transcript_142916/g.398202 Transcript_142916/m.398202 type:complete len:339 (+) Transcript_142916:1069-2085(+)
MRLPEVPLVEPMGANAFSALDLNCLLKVLQCLLVVMKTCVDPAVVSVHRVIELPCLLRGETNQRLILVVHVQSFLVARLFHANRGVEVEKLEQPHATSFTAQWFDTSAQAVSFVNLVVLQIRANQVNSAAQVPVVAQCPGHLLLAQVAEGERPLSTAAHGDRHDVVLRAGCLSGRSTANLPAASSATRHDMSWPFRQEPPLATRAIILIMKCDSPVKPRAQVLPPGLRLDDCCSTNARISFCWPYVHPASSATGTRLKQPALPAGTVVPLVELRLAARPAAQEPTATGGAAEEAQAVPTGTPDLLVCPSVAGLQEPALPARFVVMAVEVNPIVANLGT